MVTHILRRQPVTELTRKTVPRQRGQAAIEYVGVLVLLLIVAIAAVQLGIAVYAAQQAGTASRAAARVASYDNQAWKYEQAGRASMSGWLEDGATFTPSMSGDEITVTTKVEIPALLPLLDFGSVTKSATMPRD
ncbi:TadE/TadG family type IV pilus assembly protein [Streptomyces sp. NPDC001876]|uniref:TadE/TadG family type IV pilus assembly protein n=1 Tax=Streptomyces sp. NPDC001876 TaxID=3154402 RepID=UPI00332E8075